MIEKNIKLAATFEKLINFVPPKKSNSLFSEWIKEPNSMLFCALNT